LRLLDGVDLLDEEWSEAEFGVPSLERVLVVIEGIHDFSAMDHDELSLVFGFQLLQLALEGREFSF
jgi:hypothetical protein